VITQLGEASQPTRTRLVAALTLLVAVGLPVAAILTAGIRDVEVQPGAIDWILVAGVALVTVATFGLLVPWATGHARRAATTGFALAATALLLTGLFFWTMVPVIFGSAGAWLGYTARTMPQGTGPRRGLATAAIAIGAVAVLGSVAAYVVTS
jgi:MFS family permease